MGQDRSGPDPVRLAVASLFGAVQRHARWRDPTEAETAAAVNELKEILTGRNDAAVLLAETAGLISASVRAPRMSRGPEPLPVSASRQVPART